MSIHEIKSLLADPDWQSSNNRGINYLNEFVPSLDSLDGLENLLQSTQIRHEDLQERLSSSDERTRAFVTNTQISAEERLAISKELSLRRHSLADDLTELSGELVSGLHDGDKESTLLEDIETLHRGLKELESVKQYILVVQHGLQLSEAAVAQVKAATTVTMSSVTSFRDLQKFVENAIDTCENVKDGSGQQKLRIIEFLGNVRDRTWAEIRDTLSSAMIAAAEKLGWPMSVNHAVTPPNDRKLFEETFVNLLRLQTIGKNIGAENGAAHSEKDGLYPIQALVVPVSLRFKYHFESSRQTNRLDKPEWYFTHILNVAHEHRQFMEAVIQPLLQSSSEGKQIHAWREFALVLLPLLSRKLRKTIPALLKTPSVLAHTIYQALSFDASFIEEGFQLQGTSAAALDDEGAKWEGISNVILGNQYWFQAWLAGEQNFVEDQYHDIIGALDAWAISDDATRGSEATTLRSTNSARRIKALFEQVTDRYSPLPNPSQRIHFLISIQLPILDSYLSRIASSLDAFEALSSVFARAVPGALSLSGKGEGAVNVDTQNLTSGAEGVQRLCKALLSAAHVELALETWAEDLFFLELWSEIHREPALRQYAESSPLFPQPGPQDTEVPSDTIFEVFIRKYTDLVIRAEDMIVQLVCSEVEARLKAHFSSDSQEQDPTQSQEEPLISQTLLAPLTLFSTHTSYLLSTLSQTTFTALYRRIASNLAEHILHREILFRGKFDASQGRHMLAECELWIETCQGAVSGGLPGGRTRVEAPWLKLLQAARLVGLDGDIWDKVVDSTFGAKSQEEWEEIMRSVTGHSELSREVVGRVLHCREDCLV